MDILKKIFAWFVYSSKDPASFALTIKAGIPFLVLLNLGEADTLGTAVDEVVNFIVSGAMFVTGAVTAYGAIRKVFLSLPFVKNK